MAQKRTATQRERDLWDWERLVRERAHLANMIARPYWWDERYAYVMTRKAELEAILWPEPAA